jgi:hypothetical protein
MDQCGRCSWTTSAVHEDRFPYYGVSQVAGPQSTQPDPPVILRLCPWCVVTAMRSGWVVEQDMTGTIPPRQAEIIQEAMGRLPDETTRPAR